MFTKRTFLIWLSLLISHSSSFAQDACPPNGYIVLYYNGVWNSRDQAIQSLLVLRKAGVNTWKGQPVKYSLAYNESIDALNDLAEAFKQLEKEYPDELAGRWEAISSAVSTASYVGLRGLSAPVAMAVSKLIKAKMMEAFARAAPELVVQKMTNQVNELVSRRYKVVAVAHSQGNLFVNSVYRNVIDDLDKRGLHVFATVHVASPDEVVSPATYTTNKSDEVINAARFLNAKAPVGNVQIPAPDPVAGLPDSLYTGHFFEGDYLRGIESKEQILNDLNAQLDDLDEYPCAAEIYTVASGGPYFIPGSMASKGVVITPKTIKTRRSDNGHESETYQTVYIFNQTGQPGYSPRICKVGGKWIPMTYRWSWRTEDPYGSGCTGSTVNEQSGSVTLSADGNLRIEYSVEGYQDQTCPTINYTQTVRSSSMKTHSLNIDTGAGSASHTATFDSKYSNGNGDNYTVGYVSDPTWGPEDIRPPLLNWVFLERIGPASLSNLPQECVAK